LYEQWEQQMRAWALDSGHLARTQCAPVQLRWFFATADAVCAGRAAPGINPQQIELRVGQQLMLTKSSGWSSYHIDGVVTDDPTVLAISKQTAGDVIGVFTALAPGHADVGLRSDYCPTTPVCTFITPIVVP
jgi:hypothetical protein